MSENERNRPTILVVDDDDVLRLVLRQYLEGQRYRVMEAEDGAVALKKLRSRRIDLVLLDISMPGVDGCKVCDHINRFLPNPPPVLMITTLDDEDTVDQAYESGAEDYIRKPIKWAVLKNRIHHILAARRAKQELEEISLNYSLLFNSAADGICGVDASERISFVNPAALEMLGYTREEMIGKPTTAFFSMSIPGEEGADKEIFPFRDAIEKEKNFHYDALRLVRKDGTSFTVDCRVAPMRKGEKVIGCVMIFLDVTDRQEAAEVIRHMANHDSLTNLPNRNFFLKRLPQAISLARREHRLLALLFIDLDRFKPVNDRFGHSVGDKVLQVVAGRLEKMLRSSDSVCRLGGDEFVILLESTKSIQGAEEVARKAIEALNQPIEVDGNNCSVGASIGISVYPHDCNDSETMLKHADIAMYRAKKNGRDRYEIYNSGMEKKPNRRAT